MNRKRLKILRDFLARLPDRQVDMTVVRVEKSCGTVACIMGWAEELWPDMPIDDALDLTSLQALELTQPFDVGTKRHWHTPGDYTRLDAIAAIQSLIDNPDDDAMPVWPEKKESVQ